MLSGGASPALTNFDTSKDDPSVWLFTSGSTGKPKAAVHLHHDFAFNTECYAKQVLQMRADDVTLGVPKLFFGYATGTNLMFPFAVGATTVLFQRARHAGEAVRAVRAPPGDGADQRADDDQQDGARPRVRRARWRRCALASRPARRCRRSSTSAGRRPSASRSSTASARPSCSTSTSPTASARSAPGRSAGSCPATTPRSSAPTATAVPDGEIGTLWVKGDSAAICYWQAHEKSKEVLRGDWVVTGDLFRRDADGYFCYAGRADDMLKVGGIFVSPIEVESCLLRHPHVLETAVVGYEDDDGLVKPLAYVVARGVPPSETLAREIIEHCKAQLAHYKAPRRVQFVEALPRSDRGKILRRELRS